MKSNILKEGDFIYIKDNIIIERQKIGLRGYEENLLSCLNKKFLVVGILFSGITAENKSIFVNNIFIPYDSIMTVTDFRLKKLKQLFNE